MKSNQRESPIQKAIVQTLTLAGFSVIEHKQGAFKRADYFVALGAITHVPGEGRMRGCPDLQVILDAQRVVWLEVKRPVGGTVSEVQADWHRCARARGHRVYVVTDAAEALAIVRAEARAA
jgi:hypothetical protein